MIYNRIKKLQHESDDRYCPPLNFELAGKAFTLAIDGGSDFNLAFADKRLARWREGNEPAQEAGYKCLKADATTYFVSLEPGSEPPRVCRSFVLDLENDLVTRVVANEDAAGRRGILTHLAFGVIRGEGEHVSPVRHDFSSDLTGSAVQWTTGPERVCIYEYVRWDACRVTCLPDTYTSAGDKTLTADILPAAYIHIKDGLYLMCLTERKANMALSLCCLQDYNRLLSIGYAFGPLPSEGVTSAHVMLGGYGKFVDMENNQQEAPLYPSFKF